MANFSYSDYQNVIAKAQNGADGSVKIGFFKMKNDKDEALVRFNVTTLDNLQFATVHQLGAAHKWMKVSCLNPVGSYQDSCPLCAAVSAGNNSIGKASKRVYVQMMVSYKDPTTQQFAAAIPVIWERPAGFSREIANLLNDYGDLTQRVFKVTRNGAAGNMQTTYSISYIPLYDKPEAVTADFGAFANFNIAKHSFWEKSIGDINIFLNTGAFPEVTRATQTPMPTDVDAPTYNPPVTQVPLYNPPIYGGAPQTESFQAPVTTSVPTAPVTPSFTPPTFNPAPVTPAPAEEPVATQAVGSEFGRAPRTFGGLSF